MGYIYIYNSITNQVAWIKTVLVFNKNTRLQGDYEILTLLLVILKLKNFIIINMIICRHQVQRSVLKL